MDDRLALFHELSEREFRNGSFNGPSLLATCKALSAEEAARTDTYEGYSAWDNLVHCLWFKVLILRELGGAGDIEPYPWPEGSFPHLTDFSPEAWAAALEYAEKVHEATQKMLASLDGQTLSSTFKPWDCELGSAIAWLVGHDIYHNAQIRNMGLPSLRKPRKH